jgi:hypothetical protein
MECLQTGDNASSDTHGRFINIYHLLNKNLDDLLDSLRNVIEWDLEI